MSLRVVEHSSAKYTPRTYLNANTADLTVAFAVDFGTAGEKCTHRAAGEAYVGITLSTEPIEAARSLYRACRKTCFVKVLNVAGNGIYTLSAHGWTQSQVNQYVYDVLKVLHKHHPLTTIISGGQTGVDIAGIVAAQALGIDAVATLPKGYLQRAADKIDRCMTQQAIIDQINAGVAMLHKGE